MYINGQYVCPACGKQMAMDMVLGTFVWTCPEHGSPYIQTTAASIKSGV